MSAPKPNHAHIDVTDQVCPLSFVKAKLALEEIEVGQCLEVRLVDGEARHNVPRSFEREGQLVLDLRPENEEESTWLLTIQRER